MRNTLGWGNYNRKVENAERRMGWNEKGKIENAEISEWNFELGFLFPSAATPGL